MNTLALSQHTALIVGCGDVGLRIARQLQNAGATVTGIVRRDAAAIQLREAGVTGFIVAGGDALATLRTAYELLR